jgi:thymidylate synthase (FAD)
MKLDPLGDGKSALCLLDSMGNSLSVVNDARQSFAAESTEWTDRDGKLLRYLAKHHHTSPFRGVVFKWSVKGSSVHCETMVEACSGIYFR